MKTAAFIVWVDVDPLGKRTPQAALWKWDCSERRLTEAHQFARLEPGSRKVFTTTERDWKKAKSAALESALAGE